MIPTNPGPGNWRAAARGLLSLLALTLLAHFPGLGAGFNSDDETLIRDNPQLESAEGLRQIWAGADSPDYWPLTYTVFWAERQAWGTDPLPYHALRILLQGLNALLLYRILRRLGLPGAWLSAALFAIHPVQVESVAWLVELKNLLSGSFFFLALLAYLSFQDRPSAFRYALALLCFALSLLGKTSTVVLPPLLLLLDWWRGEPWSRKTWVGLAPFFLLALGAGLMTVRFQGNQGGFGGPEWSAGLPERLATAGRAFWFYLGKFLWPAELCFSYPKWRTDPRDPLAYLPLLTLILAAGFLWRRRESGWGRNCLTALGAFLLFLLPTLGFLDLYFHRFSPVADRWQYLALIGPSALLAGGAASLLARKGPGPYFSAGAAGVVLAILGAATWNQSKLYRSPISLWTDTLEKNPGSALAHVGLGFSLWKEGRAEEAARHFEESARLLPRFAEARDGLALVLADMGRHEEAEKRWREALEIAPRFALAHCNFADFLFERERYGDCLGHYEVGLGSFPGWPEGHLRLGTALMKLGRHEEAAIHLWIASRLRPEDPQAKARIEELKGRVREGPR